MQRAEFQKNLPQLKTNSQIRFRTTSKGYSNNDEGKNVTENLFRNRTPN